MKDVWFVETNCAGGKELAAVTIIAFIWRRRSVFFYYMAIMAITLIIMMYFKLAY